MLEDVHRIEFHSPLFHAGRNFGTKIEIKDDRNDGLKIQYDDKNRLFYVEYKGRQAKMPEMSAFMWEPVSRSSPAPTPNQHQTHDVTKASDAQVETPVGHVFAGPGKGKTK